MYLGRNGGSPAHLLVDGRAEVDRYPTVELDNSAAPVWSKVHLTNVEAFGGGSLAFDERNDRVPSHIHVAVGLKEHAAARYTSHLLGATVQFLTEMLIFEVVEPTMPRVPDPTLFDAPLLRFKGEPDGLADGRC